ncbi:MAG: shikimate kinase [Oscillospiraceae bacterium]|nr:shikimate kinase [Oscillospiraceae bacterium]
MEHIVLIGMMGCGKTTIGNLLSKKLGRPLLDTDRQIEKEQGCTVAQIFAREGEARFRALELELCQRLGQRKGLIVACGGGLPMQPGCMQALKQSGRVVWLRRDPGETYDGLDTSGRPLAQQGREDFLARFAQREPVYRHWADAVVTDFSSPRRTAEKVLEVLK